MSAEALLRFKEGSSLLLPGKIIPALERSGEIVAIGARVLQMACAQLRRWFDLGWNGIRVAVNLSAVQFERDDLFETVMASIARARLAPSDLELEITESAFMKDTKQSERTIGALKRVGVRIAIDDFGTGYSSLAYLHRFPVDVLKIDRAFVKRLGACASSSKIVRAIIGLAHELDIEVVAEGVETKQQRTMLEDADCDVIQGFLTGKPKAAWTKQPALVPA